MKNPFLLIFIAAGILISISLFIFLSNLDSAATKELHGKQRDLEAGQKVSNKFKELNRRRDELIQNEDALFKRVPLNQIGRASCRERV